MEDRQKFNDMVDDIVKRTGAGTRVFNKEMGARLGAAAQVTITFLLVSTLANLFIRVFNIFDPSLTLVLIGYIRFLQILIIVFGLISVLVIGIQWFAYDQLAKRKSPNGR